jgi:hypothetical protein
MVALRSILTKLDLDGQEFIGVTCDNSKEILLVMRQYVFSNNIKVIKRNVCYPYV